MTAEDKKAQVQELYGAHAKAYTTSTVHAQGASLERLVAGALDDSYAPIFSCRYRANT
jgi:uncharacterized protein YbjQ (UPF0145 family)